MELKTPRGENAGSRLVRLAADDTYQFPVIRGESDGGALVQPLGEMLYECLLPISYVEHLLAEHGLDQLADYLKSRGFTVKLQTRVADVGEVLIGELVCSEESLVQPIRKLRYRDTVEWSMRLTDVFGVRIADNKIDAFCFMSVRAGVTRPDIDVADGAYEQLLADQNTEHPEILGLVAEKLWLEQEYDKLTMFEAALDSRATVRQMHRLGLVFGDDVWREAALEKLNERETFLDDFAAYLVTIGGMRELVAGAYDYATEKCLAS